jgi:lipoprotein-releasing system permease protein
MPNYFEYFAGWRYLKAGKKQGSISLITALSAAGIVVGVMTLIIVIAVMSGAEHDFKARVLGAQPHVMVTQYGRLFSEYGAAVATIKTVPGVQEAAPFINSQIVLRSKHGMAGAMLEGIYPAFYQHISKKLTRLTPQKASVSAIGTSEKLRPIPRVMIGKALARELKVNEGDQILYMIFSRKDRFVLGRLPTARRFLVAGIFTTGLDEYDKAFVYTSLEDAQHILNAGNRVSGIEVRLTDVDRAMEISSDIKARLKGEFGATTWMQMNRNIFSALRLQKTVMFIILILIVMVAAFNVAGSLFMMVMERTRDIAILKAMGASNRSIRRIFIVKGMVIGVAGTITGALLGSFACGILSRYKFIELPGDVYYFTTLPVRLELPDILVIILSSLVICFVASLYPSYLASRLMPVEGIRAGN